MNYLFVSCKVGMCLKGVHAAAAAAATTTTTTTT
jgi:hypothetical protein